MTTVDDTPSTHHRMCSVCGHHTSGCVGGICTSFVPSSDEEIEAGAPLARYCGHDCAAEILGESLHERFARTFQQMRDADEKGER